jgi:cytoskeletal protein CcmA (bactofilin family)
VAGTVKGDVLADDKIELKPSANLQGNITAPSILIQEGATFEGQVYMQKPADLKPAPKGQSPTGDSADKESKHRAGEKKR